ncbi:hypothetical protein [Nesterenkonia sp. HG001]|uniref:hypothetical protein n=1 Tax=Nesterenkonia sp. HG001 TaxID=2983207 RepID=UPI002AC5B842|nr:hypothetical protein [Nesterenkonia sp. HG001]MDZ5077887.1 hypothetical protein [Nesterenkonia sp. HG001]
MHITADAPDPVPMKLNPAYLRDTLTPGTCITRARHCLDTGQPRLAELYMGRASQQIEEAARA